ncbi:MAG: peptide chain release factor aRF-1 [Candidatus Nanoarchaeia archaeon]|nr:peptide chain release factor aRF-1 [Candidatus Nanoarchaeia archaeon]
MINAKERYKLRQFIMELEKIRGRHTELVSVYVPAGYDIIKIIQHLAQEQGTASNIKDKNTRTKVIDSIEKMIQHLRLFKRTPDNGLAVFSGDASDKESKIDIRVWSIEPPEPISIRLYRCDQTFLLDPLKALVEVREIFGLIVLDKREANIGLLKGMNITVLSNMTSGVPGKSKAGGQSQQRFARLREEAAHEFFKRIGEISNKEFMDKPEIKGILIGGPGHTKEDFVSGSYLNTEIKNKILTVKDISYTDESGLHELVDKSHDVLAEEEISIEKKLIQRFYEMLAKEEEKTTYGYKETKKALAMGVVDILLISDTFTEEKIEDLELEADKYKTEVRIISTETREGKQLKDLGGIAAILRYPLR